MMMMMMIIIIIIIINDNNNNNNNNSNNKIIIIYKTQKSMLFNTFSSIYKITKARIVSFVSSSNFRQCLLHHGQRT